MSLMPDRYVVTAIGPQVFRRVLSGAFVAGLFLFGALEALGIVSLSRHQYDLVLSDWVIVVIVGLIVLGCALGLMLARTSPEQKMARFMVHPLVRWGSSGGTAPGNGTWFVEISQRGIRTNLGAIVRSTRLSWDSIQDIDITATDFSALSGGSLTFYLAFHQYSSGPHRCSDDGLPPPFTHVLRLPMSYPADEALKQVRHLVSLYRSNTEN
jgi:hypothetical protein